MTIESTEQVPAEPIVTEEPVAIPESTQDFYEGLLKDIPDGTKQIVEPYLKEWNSRVGKKFDELHSQLKPLTPFEELVKAGYTYDDIVQAVNVVANFNEDPRKVYEALREHYGDSGQGPAAVKPDQSTEGEQLEPWQVEFAELKRGYEALAAHFLQQQELTTEQQQIAEVDAELKALHEKHGDFDDVFVLTLMSQNINPDEAVAEFNKRIEGFAAKRNAPPAPTVLGSGGGLPALRQINPAELDSKGTRDLVAQLLEAANKE